MKVCGSQEVIYFLFFSLSGVRCAFLFVNFGVSLMGIWLLQLTNNRLVPQIADAIALLQFLRDAELEAYIKLFYSLCLAENTLE